LIETMWKLPIPTPKTGLASATKIERVSTACRAEAEPKASRLWS
jgi:hypothetical protein